MALDDQVKERRCPLEHLIHLEFNRTDPKHPNRLACHNCSYTGNQVYYSERQLHWPFPPLFVYGTLLNREMQTRIIGREIKSQKKATLNGHLRVKVRLDGTPYFSITSTSTKKNPDAFVRGRLLELTPEELERTDAYEAPYYKRIKVKLDTGREAWAYMINLPKKPSSKKT